MRYLLLILSVTVLIACSNRQVYEASQTSQKNQCDLLQLGEREECLKHLPPAYSDYERERQKIKQK